MEIALSRLIHAWSHIDSTNSWRQAYENPHWLGHCTLRRFPRIVVCGCYRWLSGWISLIVSWPSACYCTANVCVALTTLLAWLPSLRPIARGFVGLIHPVGFYLFLRLTVILYQTSSAGSFLRHVLISRPCLLQATLWSTKNSEAE